MNKLLIICLSFVFIPNLSSAASSMDLGEYIEGMNIKTSDVKSLQKEYVEISLITVLDVTLFNTQDITKLQKILGLLKISLCRILFLPKVLPQNLVMNNMLKEDQDPLVLKGTRSYTCYKKKKSRICLWFSKLIL